MKAVISQTLFTAFPTTHGGKREVVRADYDTNGWPQTARNRALRLVRKAFAVHIAGDQHLPAVVHYGIDQHRDGPIAFAGPAVNVGYPRWWEPERASWTAGKAGGSLTGDFTDSFGHPMTVMAVRNGAVEPRQIDLLNFLNDKASGLGVVRFEKQHRSITIECWPIVGNSTAITPQLPGWPVTVRMMDNYGRKVAGFLPTLRIRGCPAALVEVAEHASGELQYALRVNGERFKPHVFFPGTYDVVISDPDGTALTRLGALEARRENPTTLEITL